jgi:hypothetical protein
MTRAFTSYTRPARRPRPRRHGQSVRGAATTARCCFAHVRGAPRRLLVDREAVERESKRLVTRLKFANLRQNATVEDLNTKAARGLDKALFAKLATGDWIGRRQDLLITESTAD